VCVEPTFAAVDVGVRIGDRRSDADLSASAEVVLPQACVQDSHRKFVSRSTAILSTGLMKVYHLFQDVDYPLEVE